MDILSLQQEDSPEHLVLHWLEELPPPIRNILTLRFILMTSQDSGDFALTASESCEHFARFLCEPDFPLRRMTRILTVRSIFDFILEQDDEFFSACSVDSMGTNLCSLDTAQFLRAQKSWREICHHKLSNEQLVAWLKLESG
jgi:hypothetical protein